MFTRQVKNKEGAEDSRLAEREIIDIDESGKKNVKSTPHTSTGVYALAHAYVVYKDIDSVYADKCLAAAMAGWGYLEAHPEFVASPGAAYKMHEKDDIPQRLAAAGSLYRATGESKYNDYVKANYIELTNSIFQSVNACIYRTQSFWAYIHSGNPDPAVLSFVQNQFSLWKEEMTGRIRNSIWENTLFDEVDYFWGSNFEPLLCQNVIMTIYSKAFSMYNNEVIEAARHNLSYVLGVNPVRKSMVTGFGTDFSNRPFSDIYNKDGLPDVPAGLVVGGTNMYEGRNISRFNGKCYNDLGGDWSINEHTIYWNAAAVFACAVACHEAERIIDPVPPDAPSGFTASVADSHTVNLSWDANSEPDIAGYKIYRSTQSGFTPSVATFTGYTQKNSYSDLYADGNTQYYYCVSATDKDGNVSVPSSQVNVKTPVDIIPPATPSGFTVTSSGSTYIKLFWSRNNEIDFKEYAVYRSLVSGFITDSSTLLVKTTSTSLLDKNLYSLTKYYYKITAVDTTGNVSSPSVEISETTARPELLEIHYMNNNGTITSSGTINPFIKIVNNGLDIIPLNELRLRYFYTNEAGTLTSQTASLDYVAIGGANVTTTFASYGPAPGADTFLQLSFSEGAGVLNPGTDTGIIQIRINDTTWKNYDETNDFSWATASEYIKNENITLYREDILIWGYEPAVPEPTPTPVSTQEPTPTPQVEPTPTPTPISTPGPVTLGDVNGDNNINIVDALLVAQYYVGLNPENFNLSVADVNCSGSIEIVDALLIAQYYVNLITNFPC